MHHKAADLRALLFWPLVGLPVMFLVVWVMGALPRVLASKPPSVASQASRVEILVAEDGSRVEIYTSAPGHVEPAVKPAAGSMALLGQFESTDECLAFVPSLPFVQGQEYRAEWTDTAGQRQSESFKFAGTAHPPPTVRLAPQATLPANALKFYLHFSEPMEQGIFLERLRLLDGVGKEVTGPFRETELWSPDSKRLTVWFHPGRQKTGVNLNEDEGPVLHAEMKHTLVVAGSWRSTRGVALGKDMRFDFQVGQADHAQPNMKRWQITAPKSGTREPLVVRFDEPLDTAVIAGALRVKNGASDMAMSDPEVSSDGLRWSATPQQPWSSGTFELHAEPTLEDLAGNSLEKLFEVDVSENADTAQPTILRAFEVR